MDLYKDFFVKVFRYKLNNTEIKLLNYFKFLVINIFYYD